MPVTVKIRLGWNADAPQLPRRWRARRSTAAPAAITVHGRTREARYRHPADWDAIAEVAAAVPVPVIGNGDLLFPHEIDERLATSGCAAVMIGARRAHQAVDLPRGDRAATGTSRPRSAWRSTGATSSWRSNTGAANPIVPARRRSSRETEPAAAAPPEPAELSERSEPTEPSEPSGPTLPIRSGLDAHGYERVREFLRWHVGFWVRYAPRRPDGTWPTMQARESAFVPRSPLEALLKRQDDAALDYITDELIRDGDFGQPPVEGGATTELETMEAG